MQPAVVVCGDELCVTPSLPPVHIPCPVTLCFPRHLTLACGSETGAAS